MRRVLPAACATVLAVVLLACTQRLVPDGYDFITYSGPEVGQEILSGGFSSTVGGKAGGWCLLVVGGSRDVTYLAWPENFELATDSAGKIEVLGSGKLIRLGDEVRLAGRPVNGGVHHSLHDACESPSYFAVSSIL